MKRVLKTITLLTLCALCLSSCAVTQNNAIDVLKSYLPTYPCTDTRGEYVRKIEEDSHGRALYISKVRSPFYSNNTVALMIMQKYDDNNVYYYDDLFYLFSLDISADDIDVSRSEIVALKELNDWNKPLDESKMSSRKIFISLDNEVVQEEPYKSSDSFRAQRDEVKKFFVEEYKYTEEEFYDFYFCDYDRYSKILYTAMFEISDNQYEWYFVIFDVSGGFKWMKIDDLFSYQAELSSFKRENGWHYGID